MSSQNNSQSISINGGSIDKAQVAIAGGDVKQNQQISQNSDKEQDISSEEVYKLLSELIEIRRSPPQVTRWAYSQAWKIPKNVIPPNRNSSPEKSIFSSVRLPLVQA